MALASRCREHFFGKRKWTTEQDSEAIGVAPKNPGATPMSTS
jgi:hypothetical protein